MTGKEPTTDLYNRGEGRARGGAGQSSPDLDVAGVGVGGEADPL